MKRTVPLTRGLLALVFCLVGLSAVSELAYAQGVLVPLPKSHGMVFDHSGRYFYVTTSDGWVRTYDLSTGKLETGYNLGGELTGIDIALDDSFLLVGKRDGYGSEHVIHRVDLHSGKVVDIKYPSSGVDGTWDIVIAANGNAFFTVSGSDAPLYQINLSSNIVSPRTDTPAFLYFSNLPYGSRLRKNASGEHVAVTETASFNQGGCFTYTAATDKFSAAAPQGGLQIAINRDGTILANGLRFSVALDTAGNYNFIHAFASLGSGICLDPLDDTLYAAKPGSNEIVAYDAGNFWEKFRLPVGENVDYSGAYSVKGDLVVSPDGRHLALLTSSGVRLFLIRPAPTPSPAPSFLLADDMVFDHAGKYLYIGTFNGLIWPLNLATGQLGTPYNAGGIINGMDIAPDDSYILAAQHYHGVKQAAYQKLDLPSGVVTNITYELPYNSDDNSWDVAIASNGKAFASTSYGGSAVRPIRQIDLATNMITIRTDAPESGTLGGLGVQIQRSANRNRLIFLDARASDGPIFSYDAVSDSFGPPVYQSRYWGQTSAAVDRTGSLACWAFGYGVGGHLQSIPNFAEVKSFPDFDNGVAFDATRDVVYGVSAVNGQIRGYDTKTFAQTFSVNIGERMDSFEQFDTGNLVASQNGRYLALITPTTLRVFDVVAHSVMALPTPSPRPVYNGRLANISTRAVVHTGDDIPIAGFIITGTTTKNVIVRGIGPSLTTAGIQGALQDPTLELYDGAGHLVATNNDWLQDHQGGTIGYYGLDPSDTRESAIFAALMPGAYTAVLRGNNGTTGVGLIEIYDIEPSSNSTLANISTRSVVGLDEDVMIAGFIVKDSLAKVVCRALGPSLTRFGVTGALADPSLELHDSQGTILRFNDNWETQGAEVWNTGLGPSNYAESAIVTDLSPGNYTAIVRTIDGTQGMGLVEVYRVN